MVPDVPTLFKSLAHFTIAFVDETLAPVAIRVDPAVGLEPKVPEEVLRYTAD